jgi:hypothetical protein
MRKAEYQLNGKQRQRRQKEKSPFAELGMTEDPPAKTHQRPGKSNNQCREYRQFVTFGRPRPLERNGARRNQGGLQPA